MEAALRQALRRVSGAVCQVYSRELVGGEGFGTSFTASLSGGGKRLVDLDLPEGMGSHYAESEARLVPDDLEYDMCQIRFARGESSSARDRHERERARRYFRETGARKGAGEGTSIPMT